MTASGYSLSPKSKQYHALDSFVFEYVNAGGMKDSLSVNAVRENKLLLFRFLYAWSICIGLLRCRCRVLICTLRCRFRQRENEARVRGIFIAKIVIVFLQALLDKHYNVEVICKLSYYVGGRFYFRKYIFGGGYMGKKGAIDG